MHDRENALKEWLHTLIKHNDFILSPLFGDASFRRYFRLEYEGLRRVVMDAPPPKEDVVPFIRIGKTLAQAGIRTPELFAEDIQQGFLILGDFGDQLLLHKLNAHTVDGYYNQAIDTLFKLQECSINDPKLLPFDKEFMLREMNLCIEWFFNAYLSLHFEDKELQLIQQTMESIAREVSQQPLVFMHRDYQSRNLMLLDDNDLGVIDFQDAVRGPVTYDLVSLLKDCYISWPRAKVLEWVSVFHAKSTHTSGYSLPEFIRAFDMCGLQRHLKVLGIFCRLKLRDNKSGYIKDLPLTLKYVLECTETYEEFHPFYELLQKKVYLP
ncbi:MAG: aminoglycoside phosphotransferase family protein [Legionellales bacterium]